MKKSRTYNERFVRVFRKVKNELTAFWKDKGIPLIVVFVIMVIVLGIIVLLTGFDYGKGDNIEGIIVELHGAIFELFFLGLLLSYLMYRQNKISWQKTKNFLYIDIIETIDDFLTEILPTQSARKRTYYIFGELSTSCILNENLNGLSNSKIESGLKNRYKTLLVHKNYVKYQNDETQKALELCKKTAKRVEQISINYNTVLNPEMWEHLLKLTVTIRNFIGLSPKEVINEKDVSEVTQLLSWVIMDSMNLSKIVFEQADRIQNQFEYLRAMHKLMESSK